VPGAGLVKRERQVPEAPSGVPVRTLAPVRGAGCAVFGAPNGRRRFVVADPFRDGDFTGVILRPHASADFSEWATIRPEGQMDAPLECSTCGIRYPCVSAHLSLLIRRHSSLYFGPKCPRLSSERPTVGPGRTERDGSAPPPRRRQFVFRLLQLHARNCSGLDQRLELLHVGIHFFNSREDYSCRRAASGSIRDARLAGA
jgi:hypothetical protein